MSDEQQLLIAGEWRDAASGESFAGTNPFNGEPSGSAAAAGPDDARAAAEGAQAAFGEWSKTPPKVRSEVLGAAGRLLSERAERIAAAVTEETGGTFGWGMFNVELAAGMLQAAASLAYQVRGELIPSDVPGLTAMGVRQPAGVVLAIAPWNAPVILGTRAVAAPLACGNTVILKASEACPRTHGEIARALVDAGMPAGVISLLTHEREGAEALVDELIAHPAVRRINFTGSTAVGRKIAEKAASHLKRVLLELGGKAPMVVLDGADLQEAAAAAKFGAFMHQGQICMSTERVIAERAIAEDLSQRLSESAAALSVGDPSEPATQIGPMVSAASLQRVHELVGDALGKGATGLTGGEPDGPFFPPTVLRGVEPSMRIYYEETFGPVVSIIEVDDAGEAVRVANDTDYGLAAAVFAGSTQAGLDLATQIESGICHVNGATVHDEPQMPFGGVKASGWGRFGGTAAIEEFTELRWITLQEGTREYPI